MLLLSIPNDLEIYLPIQPPPPPPEVKWSTHELLNCTVCSQFNLYAYGKFYSTLPRTSKKIERKKRLRVDTQNLEKVIIKHCRWSQSLMQELELMQCPNTRPRTVQFWVMGYHLHLSNNDLAYCRVYGMSEQFQSGLFGMVSWLNNKIRVRV